MAPTKTVHVRRIYEAPAQADGTRVLVDRIWPRGMTKEKAHLDEWCRQVAPSTALRKWYSHDPERFPSSAAATGPNSKIPSMQTGWPTCATSPKTGP